MSTPRRLDRRTSQPHRADPCVGAPTATAPGLEPLRSATGGLAARGQGGLR